MDDEKQKEAAVAIIPLDSFAPLANRMFEDLGAALQAVKKGEVELPVGSYLAVRLLRPIQVALPPEVKANTIKVGPGFITRGHAKAKE